MLEYLPLALNLGQAFMGHKAVEKSAKKTYGEQVSLENSERMRRLSDALSNPNDPLYKQYVAEETDAGLLDYTQGLQELINQNRRLTSMGRTPLFDEERGGEQMFRALTLGRASANQQARELARKRLRQGIDELGATSKTAMSTSDAQRERRTTDALNRYQLFSGLGDALATQTSNPIRWNQLSRMGAF